MYSKMPTKRKISIFFGFGWPSIIDALLHLMYVCVSLCLLLRRSNLGHLPKNLLKCDLLRATMNGNPAGSKTGDLSAQSPRL